MAPIITAIAQIDKVFQRVITGFGNRDKYSSLREARSFHFNLFLTDNLRNLRPLFRRWKSVAAPGNRLERESCPAKNRSPISVCSAVVQDIRADSCSETRRVQLKLHLFIRSNWFPGCCVRQGCLKSLFYNFSWGAPNMCGYL